MPYNQVDGVFTVASLISDGNARLVGECDGLILFDLGAGVELFVGGIAGIPPEDRLHHCPLDFSIFYRTSWKRTRTRRYRRQVDIAAAQRAAYHDADSIHVVNFSTDVTGPLTETHVGSLIDAVVALLKLVPLSDNPFGSEVKEIIARPKPCTSWHDEPITNHILDLLSIPNVTDVERALVFLSDRLLKEFLPADHMLSIHRRNHVLEHLNDEEITSDGFGYLPYGSFLSPMFEVSGRETYFHSYYLKSSSDHFGLFFGLSKRIADLDHIPGISDSPSSHLGFASRDLVKEAKDLTIMLLGDYMLNSFSHTLNLPSVEFFTNSKVKDMSAAQLYILINLSPFGTTEKSFNHIVNNMLKGKLTGDDVSEGYGFLADAEFVKIMGMLSTLAERNGKLDEDDENFLMDDFHENQPTILALLHGLLAAPHEAGIEALEMVASSKIDAMKERKQYAIDVAHLLEEYVNGITDIPFTWYAKLGGLE